MFDLVKKDNNSKKLQIRLLQDFNVPVSRVFSFFSDHNRLSEIYPAFIRRVIDAPNPTNCNDVGSQRIIIGLPLIFTETITAYRENQYLEYKITSVSPLKNYIGKLNFINLGNDKSRLDYVIEFESVIPFTNFWFEQIGRKFNQDALGNLARKFRENPNY